MVVLKSPLALQSITPFPVYADQLGAKIRGNYQLIGTDITAEELLHMTMLAPELYIGIDSGVFHINHSMENQIKLELVNQLLSRILLYGTPQFTYQDEVFVTSVLQKIGITDVQAFMHLIKIETGRNRLVTELVNQYFTWENELAQNMAAFTQQNEYGDTVNAFIKNTYDADLFLQDEIFKRIEAAECNNTVYDYNYIYNMGTSAVKGIEPVTWMEQADEIQLVQFRKELLLQSAPAYWQKNVTVVSEQADGDIAKYVAAAVIKTIVQKISYETLQMPERQPFAKDYTGILYGSTSEIIKQLEQASMGQKQIEQYSQNMEQLYRDELQLVELASQNVSFSMEEIEGTALEKQKSEWSTVCNSLLLSLIENQRLQKQTAELLRISEKRGYWAYKVFETESKEEAGKQIWQQYLEEEKQFWQNSRKQEEAFLQLGHVLHADISKEMETIMAAAKGLHGKAAEHIIVMSKELHGKAIDENYLDYITQEICRTLLKYLPEEINRAGDQELQMRVSEDVQSTYLEHIKQEIRTTLLEYMSEEMSGNASENAQAEYLEHIIQEVHKVLFRHIPEVADNIDSTAIQREVLEHVGNDKMYMQSDAYIIDKQTDGQPEDRADKFIDRQIRDIADRTEKSIGRQIKDIVDRTINSPAMNSPAMNSPTINNPAMNSVAMNSPAMNSLTMNNLAMNNLAMNNPAMNSLTINSPAIDNQIINKQIMNSPAIDNQIIDSPTMNSPAIDNQIINSQIINNQAKDRVDKIIDKQVKEIIDKSDKSIDKQVKEIIDKSDKSIDKQVKDRVDKSTVRRSGDIVGKKTDTGENEKKDIVGKRRDFINKIIAGWTDGKKNIVNQKAIERRNEKKAFTSKLANERKRENKSSESEIINNLNKQIKIEKAPADKTESGWTEAEKVFLDKGAGERTEAEKIFANERASEWTEAEKILIDKRTSERTEAEKILADKRKSDRIEEKKAFTDKRAEEQTGEERVLADKKLSEWKEAKEILANERASEWTEAEKILIDKRASERIEEEKIPADKRTEERTAKEKVILDKRAEESSKEEKVFVDKRLREWMQTEKGKAAADKKATEWAEAEKVFADKRAEEQTGEEKAAAGQSIDTWKSENENTEAWKGGNKNFINEMPNMQADRNREKFEPSAYMVELFHKYAGAENNEGVSIMQNIEFLEQINQHNLQMKELIESQNIMLDNPKTIVVDKAQIRRNALRALENPELVLQEVYRDGISLYHGKRIDTVDMPSEVEKILLLTDQKTRQFYEQIMGYHSTPEEKFEGKNISDNANMPENKGMAASGTIAGERDMNASRDIIEETVAAIEEDQIVNAASDKEEINAILSELLYQLYRIETREKAIGEYLHHQENNLQLTFNNPVPHTSGKLYQEINEQTGGLSRQYFQQENQTDTMEQVSFVYHNQEQMQEELIDEIKETLKKETIFSTQTIKQETETAVTQKQLQEIKQELIRQNEEVLAQAVNQELKKQVHTISNKVYIELERRLKNEQRRRGY